MTDKETNVRSLRLESFRGILGPLEVRFERPGENGSALLLYGENGSGKSSICDALEFVTRGVVSRRSSDGLKRRREIKNLTTRSVPSVELQLGDNSIYRRGHHSPTWAAPGDNAITLGRANHVDGFEICPIVIRRDAVESFWRIPDESRLGFFWDYIKAPSQEDRTPKDDEALADHKAARDSLDRARKRLEGVIPPAQWPRLFSLPTHAERSQVALQKMVFEHNRGKNGKGKLSREQKSVIQNFSAALRVEEALRDSAVSAQKKNVRDTEQLREILTEIAPSIVSDFRAISREEWVTNIRFNVSDDRMEIQLCRTKGRPLSPEEILSEAALDLLALLVLVELHVACAERGQKRIIAFDDVFQSVDATLRGRALEHLAERFKGWQLVVTLHDRLWLEIADRKFKEQKFVTTVLELRGGGHGKTPTAFVSGTGPLRDLEHAIATSASGVVLAGIAGRTLEALAEQLSVRLGVLIRRKEGDRYEIGDLWPTVQTKLESCSDATVPTLAVRMGQTQFLRNRIGAHYAFWGDGISESEAADSAGDVAALWNKFLCEKCGTFGKIQAAPEKKWSVRFGCCNGGSQPGQVVASTVKSQC